MDEIVKCSVVGKTCHYSSIMASGNVVCDYIGMTGKRRGCDPEQCCKYKQTTGTKVKERLNKSLHGRMGGYSRKYFSNV